MGDASGSATDRAGNVYTSGDLDNGPIAFGNDTLTPDLYNVYLIKYDSNGQVLWARQSFSIDTTSAVQDAPKIAIDNNDNVFMCGIIGNAGGLNNAISVFGPYQLTTLHQNMFLTKYDKNGNVLWARQSVNSNPNSLFESSSASSITTDKWGNVYVTGRYRDTVCFGSDTLKSMNRGWSHTFVIKYNTNGNILWVKQPVFFTGFVTDNPTSVVTDSIGNIYVAGWLGDSLSGSINVLTYTNMYLLKYDSAGNVIWSKQSNALGLGGISPYSIAIERSGNIYVTGAFEDTVMLAGHSLQIDTGTGLFLAKYNPLGNLMWVEQNQNADSNWWFGFEVVCDTLKRGGGYLSFGASTVNFSRPNVHYKFQFGGSSDSLSTPAGFNVATAIARFDSLGNILCTSMFYEGNEDDGTYIAASPSSRFIYISGDIGDLNEHVKLGNDSLTEAGDFPFLARWQKCCGAINSAISIINDTCNANHGAVIDHATGTFTPFTYTWNIAGDRDSSLYSVSAGTYTVTIEDADGCSKTTSAIVNNINTPVFAQVCCDTLILNGNSVTISVNDANQYLWSPDLGLSCNTCQTIVATPSVTTRYYVTVTNQQGCTANGSVLITVECPEIFVPNAFSPNADNIDDIEYVYGGCIQALDFKIFDRWGNLVFETTDPTKGWDGTFNGKPMSTGFYDYTLVTVQSNGKSTDLKGNITLVR